MARPDFWDDGDEAQKILRHLKVVRNRYETLQSLESQREEIEALFDLLEEAPDDGELQEELKESLPGFQKQLDAFETELLLQGPYDERDALLSIHPGAGGTEAQDWGAMLLRMYTRWAEEKGFQVEVIDYQEGEEAGIKSATLAIKGPYAYGYLRGERGVHRLVRHSPFDASGRRHTSFAAVDVLPVLDPADEELKPEDLEIQFFRASGPGGQHVNKTESAVRITHKPTGITVSCQSERSQHANREHALTLLRAKVAQRRIEEREKELQAERGQVGEIAWGNQIRSYVFEPYTLVKDHRTGVSVGNIRAVMDGDIDIFIMGFLRQGLVAKS